MVTFIGNFECRADVKGRIVLPAAFKKAMGDNELRFIVRKHIFDNCLEFYPYNNWKDSMEELRKKLNPYNRNHNILIRNLFKDATELTLDGNGRFLIPQRMIDLIGGARDVILVGIDNRIEMWAKEVYDLKKDENTPDTIASMAEEILGIDK
jgi:MraZ protein